MIRSSLQPKVAIPKRVGLGWVATLFPIFLQSGASAVADSNTIVIRTEAMGRDTSGMLCQRIPTQIHVEMRRPNWIAYWDTDFGNVRTVSESLLVFEAVTPSGAPLKLGQTVQLSVRLYSSRLSNPIANAAFTAQLVVGDEGPCKQTTNSKETE